MFGLKIVEFSQREYKSNELYVKDFLQTLIQAAQQIFNNAETMRTDSIELITDFLIQFVENDENMPISDLKELSDLSKMALDYLSTNPPNIEAARLTIGEIKSMVARGEAPLPREAIAEYRRKKFHELIHEFRTIRKLKEDEPISREYEEQLWKKANIAAIGKVLDWFSRYYSMTGHKLKTGIGSACNGKTALIPLEMFPSNMKETISKFIQKDNEEEEEIGEGEGE